MAGQAAGRATPRSKTFRGCFRFRVVYKLVYNWSVAGCRLSAHWARHLCAR